MNVIEKFKAEGECRLCRRPNKVRKLSKHRIVPGRRPWRGRYEWQNVVPLCEPCHRDVERIDDSRRMLRLCLWPVEVAYAYARMGDDFDRMYPSRGTKPYVREKLDYLRVASTRENHSDERPTFTRTVRPHPPAVSRAAISK